MSKTEKAPGGWLIKRLDYLIKSMDAGVSVNSEDCKAQKGEYGILKTSAVTTGVFDPDENKTIVATEIKRAKISPTRDRIIMSRMNTPALVGANAYISQTREDLFLPDRLWQLTPEEGRVSMRWLSFVLGSPKYRSKLSSFATGTSNSMKNITKSDVKSLPILLPPLPEQKAIADLLSTWDEAIEKTERLIQAKEKRFKWLLRKLISEPRNTRKGTGWKKVKLGEIGEIKKGKGITKADLTEKGIPCIRYAEIYTNYHFNVSEFNCFVPDDVFGVAFEIIKGDIIFAASGETKEEIGKCVAYVGSKKACTGGDTLVLRSPTDLCDPVFLGFALNHPNVNKQKSAYAHGNSVVHLYAKDLLKVEVLLPPLEEQEQTAETLSAAQQEIDLLRQLAEKYKTQKRGLMQKMLTGEWRVKEEIVMRYE